MTPVKLMHNFRYNLGIDELEILDILTAEYPDLCAAIVADTNMTATTSRIKVTRLAKSMKISTARAQQMLAEIRERGHELVDPE